MFRKLFVGFTFLFCCVSFAQNNIFDAARTGDISMLKTFLSQGGNIDTLNADGNSLLILSIYKNQSKCALWLIKKKANIHVQTSQGNALLAAIYKGNIDITERLLKDGADVNSYSSDGNSALQYAVLSNSVPLVKCCLAYHPNIQHRNNDEKSAYDLAVALKNSEIIALLNP